VTEPLTLLTGATGFVGSAVARALLARGHRVRALARPKSDRRNLPGLNLEIAEGDLSDPASLARAVQGCRFVLHVAADYRIWVPDPEAMLRAKAAQLRNIKVVFPGHVHGQQKQAHFSAADLYVFPSRHESYGLTLMEAFQYGLPAITLDHAGARAVMQPEFGAVATKETFLPKLQQLVAEDLPAKGRAARAFAQNHSFSAAAAKLATLLTRL
jgi:glycosyltransferase involved in cell wall biosynthesis